MSNDNKPAAAQEAVAWSKTKPTAEGAYYVRGFNLFQIAQYEALVQVRMHHFDGEPEPELVCNIHESTSNADMDDWSPIVEMSEDFEWLGPMYAAPVAAAPVEPLKVFSEGPWVFRETGQEFSGADLDEAAFAEYRRAGTPAAPGIDLEQFRALAIGWRRQIDRLTENGEHGKACALSGCANEVIALIDASPKGGSDVVQIPDTDGVREILGRMCFQCIRLAEVLRLRGDEIGRRAEDEQAAVLRFLLNHYLASPEKWAECAQAEIDAIRKQATSAEVGA